MEPLIARYIYDVVRRLPEKEREDVGRELKANLYDMLTEDADEAEVLAVLREMGDPAELAEKYRQKPRQLMSPALFSSYLRVLKYILPITGVLAFVVGMVLGAMETLSAAAVNPAQLAGNVIAGGFSLAFPGMFQALLWTTVGYIIADRTGAKKDEKEEEGWDPANLPELPPQGKYGISPADSIAELILTLVFSFLAVLICSGIFPVSFLLKVGEAEVQTVFSPEFLVACIPWILLIAVLSLVEIGLKLKVRRWTPPVAAAAVASNLIGATVSLYLLNRPDLFSPAFVEWVGGLEWEGVALTHFVATGSANPVILTVSIVILLIAAGESAVAVYKTLKNRQAEGTGLYAKPRAGK